MFRLTGHFICQNKKEKKYQALSSTDYTDVRYYIIANFNNSRGENAFPARPLVLTCKIT